MTDLVVYSDLGRYGAGRVMATLATGLAASGHSVEVVTFTPAATNHPLRDERWRLTVLNDRPAQRPGGLWRHLRAIRPRAILLADHRFAVGPAMVARCACPGAMIAVVLHCDPLGLLAATDHMTVVRLAAWRAYLAGGLRAANAVVAVSDGVRRQAAAWLGLGARRTLTIHNPVLSPALRDAARAPAGHPWLDHPGQPVVLGVGRLSHEKDWPTLVRAFAQLRAELRARLVLLGEGPERPRLERLVRDLGLAADVALLGEVHNPYAFMARAGVLGHASRSEGLANVLIEALGLGLPVVAADCPVGPAEILEGGRWGRLVPVGDPAAMAMALRAVIHDREPVQAQHAVWARFGAASSVAAYQRLLFRASGTK